MDNHKQDDDNQDQPPAGRFMDIQSPGSDNESTTDEPISTESNQPVSEPYQQTPQADEPPAAASVGSSPEESSIDTSASEPTPTQSDPQSAIPGPEQVTTGQNDHKHQGIPAVALVVAIIVTLALSGLVVYSYLKSNKDSKIGTQSSSTEQSTVKPVTSTEVDATAAEIEKSLNAANDSTDFPEDSLSDTTLGL